MNNDYRVLVQTKRGDVADCKYYGSIYLSDSGKIIRSFGTDENTLFYMRSLAKPLQSSIMFDCNIVDELKLLPNEIAIMTGSHAGSPYHIKVLKNLVKRFNIKTSQLLLAPSSPLDLRGFSGRKTKLHNNCSGKHIMMNLMSRYLGFSEKDYINPNHPIQKLIYNKQAELSEYKSKNVSFDGCGTPLWEIPASGIIKAYYNLINDKKYSFLINSILKYPDIFGGFNRLDSDIIKLSNGKLFSKVGAGGFILIYNLSLNQSILIKMAQNNNDIRKLVAFDILNKLNWLNLDIEEFEYNQQNKKVAKYYYEFEI